MEVDHTDEITRCVRGGMVGYGWERGTERCGGTMNPLAPMGHA